jgi:hypothetical protein
MRCRNKDDKCDDCNVCVICKNPDHDAEHYVVHNELWPEGVRVLCVGCLETRLGRQLVADDFTDCPLNDPKVKYGGRYAWTWRSERLQDRLAGVTVTPWDGSEYLY